MLKDLSSGLQQDSDSSIFEQNYRLSLLTPQNALKKYTHTLPLILNVLKKHMFFKRVLFQ